MTEEENKKNMEDIEADILKNDLLNDNTSKLIRISKTTRDCVITNEHGEPLSPLAKKFIIISLFDINPEDSVFYDGEIKAAKVADILGMDKSGIFKAFKNGLDHEIRTATVITFNEENKRIRSTNLVKYCEYDPKTYAVGYKFNEEIKDRYLKLGKNNPYYSIFKKEIIALPKTPDIDVFMYVNDLINDKEMGKRSYQKNYVKIDLQHVRDITLIGDKYSEPKDFHVFIKRHLEKINEKTSIYIYIKDVEYHDDENFALIPYKRDMKKEQELNDLPLTLDEQQRNIFGNDELDKAFADFIEGLEAHKIVSDKQRIYFAKHLKELATVDNVFDTELALAILEQSIRNGWKDLRPLNFDKNAPVMTKEEREKVKKECEEDEMEYLRKFYEMEKSTYGDMSFEKYCEIKRKERRRNKKHFG